MPTQQCFSHTPPGESGPPLGRVGLSDTNDAPAQSAQSILEQAQAVLEDRGRDYGDFSETLQRIARVWEELVGDDEWESRSFRSTIVARFMVALKMVRERGGFKEDNWVDALNYSVGGCRVGAKEENANSSD